MKKKNQYWAILDDENKIIFVGEAIIYQTRLEARVELSEHENFYRGCHIGKVEIKVKK